MNGKNQCRRLDEFKLFRRHYPYYSHTEQESGSKLRYASFFSTVIGGELNRPVNRNDQVVSHDSDVIHPGTPETLVIKRAQSEATAVYLSQRKNTSTVGQYRQQKRGIPRGRVACGLLKGTSRPPQAQ